MPMQVKCSNPDCGATFEVGDEKTGVMVTCPRCGTSIRVEAQSTGGAGENDILKFEDDSAGGAGDEQQEAAKGFVDHPARQKCSSCGAVLGVSAAFCPTCGADIRTGTVVTVRQPTKKGSLKPFVIGGAVLAGLIVLVVLAVVLLGGREKPAADEEAEAIAQRPEAGLAAGGRALPAEDEKPREAAFQMSEEKLTALRVQETEIRRAVQSYKGRLNDVVARLPMASTEEMAGLWADLYAFCRDDGLLQTEAELCWERAVRLRPTDETVNRTLGRTESFRGVPVTPEQKQFLDSLQPRLLVINCSPDLSDHSVRLQGKAGAPFPWGESIEMAVEAGLVKVEIVPAGAPDRPTLTLALDAKPGLVYTAEVKKAPLAPAFPFEDLGAMYAASQGGDVEGVTVERDAQGNALVIRTQQVSASGSADTPLRMRLSADGSELALIGTLAVGRRFQEGGQEVVYGGSQRPVRLAIDNANKTVAVRAGVYYTLRTDFADGLWGVLGTADGDFASEWARKELLRRLAAVDSENVQMEARGELLGAWQALVRVQDGMSGFHQELQARLAYQDQAAGKPAYLDRARVLGLEDRVEHLYLNWPRFRQALASATQVSEAAIRDCLKVMGRAEESPAQRRTRGPASASPEFGGRRPAQSRVGSLEGTGVDVVPEPLELEEQEQLYVLMRMLPLFSDQAALQCARDNWSRLNAQARIAALVSLERIATPEVVSFLGQQSQQAGDTHQTTGALLSLGAIGTPQALQYCDTPAILSDVRAASVVARAVAGDPDTLDQLPQFLEAADEATKASFLAFISRMETPTTWLVLSRAIDAYEGKEELARIAAALAHVGGHAAMSELARLMEKSGQVFPEALAAVDPQEAALLIDRVGHAVADGKGGEQAPKLLAQNGSDAALGFLQAAASRGSAQVVEALMQHGSPRAIEAAAEGAEAVSLEVLRSVQRNWCETDDVTGQAALRSGVDPMSARYFLEKVLARGGNPKVRVAAAAMLHGIGQAPDADMLLAVARQEKAAAEPAEAAPSRGAVRGRAGRRTAEVEQYRPAGFQEPQGIPKVPRDLTLEGKAPIYALGLLMTSADAKVPAQLRELTNSYQDPELKAAAMRALGAMGGEQNLEFLRSKATGRKGNYDDLKQLVTELQDRMAAVVALGVARDAVFLPHLLDILHEAPTGEGSVKDLKDDYAKLSEWWQLKLCTSACQSVAEMCRMQPLAELAADSDLQGQLVGRLEALIEQPAPAEESLSEAATGLRAQAVRAFGRAGSPTRDNRLVLSRLAFALEQQKKDTAGRRRGVVTRWLPGTTTPEKKTDPLSAALMDAVAHMAARSAEPGGFLALLDGLLESDDLGAQWTEVVLGLAESTTPSYLELASANFDRIPEGTRREILSILRQRGPSDQQYTQWLVTMAVGPAGAEAGDAAVAAGRQVGARGAPRRVSLEERSLGRSVEMQAMVEAEERAFMEQEGPPPEVLAGLQAEGPVPDGRRPSRRRTTAAVRAEYRYDRAGVRRQVEWSYTLEQLDEQAAGLRRKWSLIERLFEADARAVSAAVAVERLMEHPQFGPAIATLYAARVPDARSDIVRQLGEMLVGEDAQASAGLGRLALLRSAVAALRRIGTDAAVSALYMGLVGPAVQQTPAGMPGAYPDADDIDLMYVPPGMQQARPPGVAVYIARALGTMGKDDLLRRALNAAGNEFYRAGPLTVQKAALEGIAYLPAERKPISLLEALLAKAPSGELRLVVARALVTALRHMAAR